MQNKPASAAPTPSHLPWLLIGIFLILLAALFYARIYADQQNRITAETATSDRLNSIAGLKREQISTWLSDHKQTALLLSRTSVLTGDTADFLTDPDASVKSQGMRNWLENIRLTYGYREVHLASIDGQLLISSPDGALLSSQEREGARSAAGAVSGPNVYTGQDGQLLLDYYVHLQEPSNPNQAYNATLILSLDASSLFELVNSWPYPTSTTEILLIQQDGDDVVLLNQPELSGATPISTRFPLGDNNLAVSQAAQRKNGTGAGLDYRGVPVLFSFQEVPSSNWIVVVKVDQEEIYAPIRENNNLISLLTVALFVAAMLASVLTTRQREGRYYREMYLAEVRRQALSEHLLYLSRYANDIILLTDDQGNILEANDRAVSAYQITQEDLDKTNLYQLSDDESRIDLVNQLRSLNSLGGLVFETAHRRGDGTIFPVECSARIIDIGEKKFYQFIIRDITERRQAEESLRQSERRFRLFYEQAPISYQSLDLEGCITDVNQAWVSAYGYRRAEVTGRPFVEFLSEESCTRWETAVQELRLSGELRGCEVEIRCANGERVIVSITGKISHDETQHMPLLHCVLNDVTEQRIAAAQIQRMNEELEKRVLERTAQLEAANKELEAFSYSVSHDLRAPLRAIDGFTRIVLDDYTGGIQADASRYLTLVRENAHTMSNLIDNLLTFSRLSRHPLKKQRINMNELVNEALKTLTTGQECRQVQYILHTLPACDADPLLLRQVFINLLSNAIKFTGKKPSAVIEVGCLQEGRETIFYVKDNGIGFDMQYAPKLFGVFQRLHKVEDYEGTGVGLAIVQRIIHRHGGRVWAMGEVDQGATFCFTLEETDHHD